MGYFFVCFVLLSLTSVSCYYCLCVEPSGPPADLMILASGPSTLTVSWSAPLLYPEVVLNYIVRCAPEGDNSNYLEDTNSNTRFTAQFDNLIPNTTYICEVHTTSNFGNSTPVIVSANTLPRESTLVGDLVDKMGMASCCY